MLVLQSILDRTSQRGYSQKRSYSTFYGLVSERFSKLNRVWNESFEKAFETYYATIHRLRNESSA